MPGASEKKAIIRATASDLAAQLTAVPCIELQGAHDAMLPVQSCFTSRGQSVSPGPASTTMTTGVREARHWTKAKH